MRVVVVCAEAVGKAVRDCAIAHRAAQLRTERHPCGVQGDGVCGGRGGALARLAPLRRRGARRLMHSTQKNTLGR